MVKQKCIIKRDGRVVDFDKSKIQNAILKAFKEVDGSVDNFAIEKANNIANYIEEENDKKDLDIETIQDMVENGLMATKRKDVAKAYILYRNKRSLARGNRIDKEVLDLLDFKNEYWKRENSNKDSVLVTTQRDYIAGIVSADMSRRLLLPDNIVKAHDSGEIHFHDSDYFLQNALHNCDLINLGDMLLNGTVVNKVMIESPHKFSTACTISTQIILGVSSSQYGGCTISLTHLAPFVRRSYEKFYKKYINLGMDPDKAKELAKYDTKVDISDGVQTFNYQVNSMSNTNGQAPFLSVFMYLGETDEYKEELAMIIEEFLKQRIQGLKNEAGAYVTQSFPKLLYVLEKDNITEDSKYWYLTELAAKCIAKRQVPDCISEYMMLKLKGDCYPCINKTCA